MNTTGSGEREMPEWIGRYKVLDILGEGGMGTVYLAEQREPVWRRVALKVIKLGMDSAEVLRRFEVERQALAMMDHPNIAKVFDAGTTDRGQAYFSMEYVKGKPITEYADAMKLSVEDRLRLFQQVCHGVQHAHQKGVIHRDLTPRNVLVVDQDGDVRPKIIDFGLARATDHRLTEGTLYTQQGQVFGTPAYMSPEQAGFENHDVDTRADVYTLGVLLYELLTGELPFGKPGNGPAGFLDFQRRIRESEPKLPSTVVTVVANRPANAELRHAEPHTLVRKLRGDLDWIVMRAIERDRNRRYETANALAMDIQRHLDDQPVLAGPPTATYRLHKFVRRYRLQVIAGSLLLLSLIGGVIGTTWFLFEARANEIRAVKAADDAKSQKERADQEARLATAARADADRRAVAEKEAREEAVANLAKFELLSNVVLLREAKASAEQLAPETPDLVPAMREWLADRGEPLARVLPELEKTLDELRKRGKPREGGETSFGFEQRGDQFLHDTLDRLVADLHAFVDEKNGQLQTIRDRLAWSESVQKLSIDDHKDDWVAARRAILRADDQVASKLYADPAIELEPQLGLVPIGMNPVTKLWEFYDLRSAEPGTPIPAFRADGTLEVRPETGIVLVLLPGGEIMITGDPASGSAGDTQKHVAQVEPFFISRYEMTQAQWRRLSRGDNPSYYVAGREIAAARATITEVHPVEQVSWPMCERLLHIHGLRLPTDTQWEYACRAGTETTWSTGPDSKSLQGFANVADATAKKVVPTWTCDPLIDDGWVIHAPVGSFGFNAFGLHDVHGNVWEWCQDAFGTSGARVMRGGSHTNAPDLAASGNRSSAPADARSNNLGLRPARLLTNR
ncbi:MAG: bifunctional serine/threonine-protein kinase/formylglycine-generating enzyme family protein [Planctomycetota bacterium]